MDIFNRPTGWFRSIGCIVCCVTESGSKLFGLLFVEGTILVFRWTPVVALDVVLDWVSVQVYFIVVD